MQLGFITNCLSGSFSEKVRVASELGYDTLEVACWPEGDPKQCDISADNYTVQDIIAIQGILNKYQCSISTLAFYENSLSANLEIRKKNLTHLRNVITLASKLNVDYVGMYIGKDQTCSLEQNFILAQQLITPIVEYAAGLGVTLLFENCPMPTWDAEGYPATISYSPELIQHVFEVIPNNNFGLNYDPSHLYWMGIDYLSCAQQFSNRIYSIHVKDVSTKHNNIDRYGIYGKEIEKQHPFDFGYYQPTLVGYGEINWNKLFDVLKQNQFNGPIQVEYKNGNGYGEAIKSNYRGLELSHNYLAEILNMKGM